MQLSSLKLDDWKSFGSGPDASNVVRLAPVTVLIGPNASGKSNVLDALRFLQGAALDYSLGEILRGHIEGQREIWPGIRGGTVEAARSGTTGFALTTEWVAFPYTREPLAFQKHVLKVDTQGEVAVEEEGLFSADGDVLFHTHAPSLGTSMGRTEDGGLRVASPAFGKGNFQLDTLSSSRSLLAQLGIEGRAATVAQHFSQLVRSSLRGIVFLDIQPARMRDYKPENGGQLGVSGENISPALLALSQQEGRLQDVVDWLSEFCAPEIERIDFDRTQLREVMMFLVERGGRRVSARSVSDGTLRFLGHLVALLTCAPGTLVVLEEPDAGLHPSRIHLLAELIERITKDRGIQVLATTHSPTLLAHLSDEALGDVVAFGRRPENGLTVCSRLKDLPHFDDLRRSDHLERLISTGWVERAL
jgi:predicted ATPase